MKVCVLVPAYNCAETIEEVCRRLPLAGPDDEVIVVDDASADGTLSVASRVPRVHAERNPRNLGYGGTSRRLYEIARERGAETTVNVHGDLGHRPEEIAPLLEELGRGDADIVVGSRLLFLRGEIRRLGLGRVLADSALRHDMPRSRVVGHFALTAAQNLVYRSRLSSFHEGMRACTRRAMDWILEGAFPTRYTYDLELLFAAHKAGLRIREVPVPPNYDHRAKGSAPPVRYGLKVLRQMARVLVTGR